MRITLINGHPDPAPERLAQALCVAYAEAAQGAGHETRVIRIADLDFPFLRSKQAWESQDAPAALHGAQKDVAWAEHLVFVYPLWLGDLPAALKAFLEQVCRPGFAFGRLEGGVGDGSSNAGGAEGEGKRVQGKARAASKEGGFGVKPLKGKTASIVVTMGMPGLIYRWFFLSHSLRSFRRNILAFVGIATRNVMVLGMIEAEGRAESALARMRELGRRAG